MIVTKHFVYIHVSRTGGTFLNKLILEHVPGARMLQYHGQLRDLPEFFSHLPVIGFVRNPWDWYVSMFCDYLRQQQYLYEVVLEGGDVGLTGANVADGAGLTSHDVNPTLPDSATSRHAPTRSTTSVQPGSTE